MEMEAGRKNTVKILICFKVVHDLDLVMEEDWEQIGGGNPDISYTRTLLGCWDEAALENGLRLGDQLRLAGKEVQVTALTVGEEFPGEIVGNLYGVKCDRVVFWECGEDLRFCPERVAERIAFFVREDGGFDLILTGQQAPVGDSGKIPWAVAWYLGLPALTWVRELCVRDNAILAITEAEGWERSFISRGPMVCALGNARYPYLRVATLKEMLSGKKKQPWLRNDNGWIRTGENVEPSQWKESQRVEQPYLKKFYRNRQERKSVAVEGESTRDRAVRLYQMLKEADVL